MMAEKNETTKIRVLIVDDVQLTRTDIRRLLYFEDDMEVCGEAANGREALECVDKCLPDVILMDINMPVLDGISATEALTRSHPHVSVVIISIQAEQEYLRKAMIAGARDYLIKPLSSEDLASTIRQVYRASRERNHIKPTVPEQVRPLGDYGTKGAYKVITIFSGKGGSGKTFLAGNLAAALAKKELSVALVDLDLQFGDIAVLYNLSGTRTISDLVDGEEANITTAQLRENLIRHLSGVSVLAAPASPPEAEKITVDHVEAVIHTLKQLFDCVIIDIPTFFGDITLLALEQADLILLPVRRDIATIKNTRASLDVLNSLEYGEKVRIILNQANLDSAIDIAELEHSLGHRISHHISSDEKAVVSSINRGIPLVMEQSGSEISKDLCRLADKVKNGFTEKEKAAARKVTLGRIFSLTI